jgi:hypothetical protein
MEVRPLDAARSLAKVAGIDVSTNGHKADYQPAPPPPPATADDSTKTIREVRAAFWRAAFRSRAQAVRWWIELMAAFGASLPEASAWANQWADRHGYR